jgi:hypothetical protein
VKGATSVAPFTFSPKTFGELKRRIYLCNKEKEKIEELCVL